MGSVKFTGTLQLTPAEDEHLWRDLYRGLNIKKNLDFASAQRNQLASAIFASAIYMDWDEAGENLENTEKVLFLFPSNEMEIQFEK